MFLKLKNITYATGEGEEEQNEQDKIDSILESSMHSNKDTEFFESAFQEVPAAAKLGTEIKITKPQTNGDTEIYKVS